MTNKEAIEVLKSEWMINSELFGKQFDEALNLAIKALDELPPGEWLKNDYQPYDYDTVFKCSICGKEIFVPDHIAAKVSEHDKYCYNCGARMEGKE